MPRKTAPQKESHCQTISNLLKSENIDWLKIIDLAKDAYETENKSNSILGFQKGFLNLFKIGQGYWAFSKIAAQIKIFYPDAEILSFSRKCDCLQYLKKTKLNLSDKLVIIITDKTTIEPIMTQLNIPYLKFTGGEATSSKKIKDESGKETYHYEYFFRIKKDGDKKGFKWKKEDTKSLNRDSKLLEIFDED